MSITRIIGLSLANLCFMVTVTPCAAGKLCAIQVVDDQNGWPVPLVELRTVHGVRFVSDNAGLIAFDLPELMNRPTWFSIEGHGYGVLPDGFGNRGVTLIPRAGESLTIKVQRALPAERVGRLTGAGLFAESQKLGQRLDWQEQGVLGCDSVQTVIHNGRLYWGWGDSQVARYPLGLFHMLGATTEVNPLLNGRPPLALRFDYFISKDYQPRNVAELPGLGPTWLDGYASLPDANGRPHLVASYAKIRPPLTAYEKGLCEWNATTGNFERIKVLWTLSDQQPEPPSIPHGHPVRTTDAEGKEWIEFGDPFPTLRCRATYSDWLNPERWESLPMVEHVSPLKDSPEIQPHRGSIAWNTYRQKWTAIFTQRDGKASPLGEIWYAEADRTFGPWEHAVHVVTHNNYTFYNPLQHPEWTTDDPSVMYFEGTYTATFSGSREPTPRYDYNQILYRLDLKNLALPP